MTRLLVDTSVVIKWFHAEGESEVDEARAIRAAHVRGELDAHVLDLAVYEVGNVLGSALKWPAVGISAQLDDLVAIVGTPLVMARDWLPEAARLAERHALSFYDASWAAAAVSLRMPLVTANRRLLAAGLGRTPSEVATRLDLDR